MRKTVCEKDMCTGCAACLDICPKDALIFEDSVSSMNVFVDSNRCIGCNACLNVCQVNEPAKLSPPFFWKQGWAKNDVRRKSSSGGFATQLMMSFIDEDSYVCSCVFKAGHFSYYVTNNAAEIDLYKGSKYVKSNPKGIYKEVNMLLNQGKRCLFVGLPCHIAAMKKYLHGRYEEQLYTVDLICHGAPSPEIIKKFLTEHKYDIHSLKDIRFRVKNTFDVLPGAESIVPIGTLDRYTIGFLRGLFYTENCYSCNYAKLDRISDITIGDSWGTELLEEEKKGISIALCQTDKGKKLLLKSNLKLFDVDIDKAVATNHQLRNPSKKIPERARFFDELTKTGSVEKGVFSCFPKECMKQELKGILIKLHINHGV